MEECVPSVILRYMLTVSLKDFITTGNFGPIELGMHIDRVKELLGEPEMWTGPDFTPGHGIIVYAWYEFFYSTDTGAVYGIQNDHLATMPNLKTGRVNNKRDICFTNELFTIDIWFLKKNRYMTYGQVTAQLDREGILYKKECIDGYIKLVIPGGADIVFDELEGVCVLTGISYFDLHAFLPAHRQ